MPVLNTVPDLQKVYLPTYKDLEEADRGWVVINTGELTTQDILKADAVNTDVELTVQMLVSRIVEWNLTDANGVTLDINFDNVSKLRLEDYKSLAELLRQTPEGLDVQEKKDLNPISAPSIAVPVQTS